MKSLHRKRNGRRGSVRSPGAYTGGLPSMAGAPPPYGVGGQKDHETIPLGEGNGVGRDGASTYRFNSHGNGPFFDDDDRTDEEMRRRLGEDEDKEERRKRKKRLWPAALMLLAFIISLFSLIALGLLRYDLESSIADIRNEIENANPIPPPPPLPPSPSPPFPPSGGGGGNGSIDDAIGVEYLSDCRANLTFTPPTLNAAPTVQWFSNVPDGTACYSPCIENTGVGQCVSGECKGPCPGISGNYFIMNDTTCPTFTLDASIPHLSGSDLVLMPVSLFRECIYILINFTSPYIEPIQGVWTPGSGNNSSGGGGGVSAANVPPLPSTKSNKRVVSRSHHAAAAKMITPAGGRTGSNHGDYHGESYAVPPIYFGAWPNSPWPNAEGRVTQRAYNNLFKEWVKKWIHPPQGTWDSPPVGTDPDCLEYWTAPVFAEGPITVAMFRYKCSRGAMDDTDYNTMMDVFDNYIASDYTNGMYTIVTMLHLDFAT